MRRSSISFLNPIGVYSLLLFFLLLSWEMEGLYYGNPSSPMMPENGIFFPNASLSLKGGYEFDDVFNLKLKMQDYSAFDHKKIKKFSSKEQLGVLTLGLADRIELYSGLGSMSLKMHQNLSEDIKLHYSTDTHFCWTFGGRTIFAYWRDLQFGLAASYLHFSPAIHSISLNSNSINSHHAKMHYRQWQVGAGISYRIDWLFPYIGVKYSNTQAKFFDLDSLELFFPSGNFTVKSKKQLGLIIGCGFSPEKGFSLNAEGRFIDETAFTLSTDVRF